MVEQYYRLPHACFLRNYNSMLKTRGSPLGYLEGRTLLGKRHTHSKRSRNKYDRLQLIFRLLIDTHSFVNKIYRLC